VYIFILTYLLNIVIDIAIFCQRRFEIETWYRRFTNF